MIGARISNRSTVRYESEIPFWISLAALLAVLMVVFLVVMNMTLSALSELTFEMMHDRHQRMAMNRDIGALLENVATASKTFPDVIIDVTAGTIGFGDQMRFDAGSSRLSAEQAIFLRRYVASILTVARSDIGRRWLKRIVVEGLADQRGTYLGKLHLSLQRSERVMCALLSLARVDEAPLDATEREEVRKHFSIGTNSFNSPKSTLDESQRLVLRLEFYDPYEEPPDASETLRDDLGECGLPR